MSIPGTRIAALASGPMRPWVLASLLAIGGCVSDQPSYSGGTGELGKGSFFVPCGTDDAACGTAPSRLASDVPFAVGASSLITYEGEIPDAPTGQPTTITIFSASPAMLSFDDAEIFAWLPGTVAVLARSAEGTVTDFAHLTVAPVASIDLGRTDEAQEVGLSVGEQGVWEATPRDASGQVLGGHLAYAFEVQGEAVEVVDQSARRVTLIAREAGTATLRALAADAVGEATVVVEEAR